MKFHFWGIVVYDFKLYGYNIMIFRDCFVSDFARRKIKIEKKIAKGLPKIEMVRLSGAKEAQRIVKVAQNIARVAPKSEREVQKITIKNETRKRIKIGAQNHATNGTQILPKKIAVKRNGVTRREEKGVLKIEIVTGKKKTRRKKNPLWRRL